VNRDRRRKNNPSCPTLLFFALSSPSFFFDMEQQMHYLAELAIAGPKRLDELEAFLSTGDRSTDGWMARTYDGRTALMLAASNSGRPDVSSERVVELLIPHSNVSQVDYAGNTALGLALANYQDSTEQVNRAEGNTHPITSS
jgi:hypothetical protein